MGLFVFAWIFGFSGLPGLKWEFYEQKNSKGWCDTAHVGHVEGYISETVQDAASGTIND